MQTTPVFTTDNFSKFVTCVTLGVPPLTATGRPPDANTAPEWREISSEQLKENGFATIEDAEEARFIGTIVYGLGDHQDRKRIGRAFDKAHHTPKETLDFPDVLDLRTAKGKEKALELLATFAALLFRNRNFFNDRRSKVRAKLRLKKTGSDYAVIDRRASAEVKERFSV